ncbi:thyrotropin receptor [Nematostella vectensis]|nr:thyrotropin receptor [Nematostella vectensis]
MSSAGIHLFIVLLVVHGVAPFHCGSCSCFQDEEERYGARCSIKNQQLDFNPPQGIQILDLSNNSLTKVPSWLFKMNFSRHINSMTLAHNQISTIEDGDFKGLDNLYILDLSFNSLTQWNRHNNSELGNLQVIYVTGNENWTPGQWILQMRMLSYIIGVTWPGCKHCPLIRTSHIRESDDNETRQLCQFNTDDYKFSNEIEYGLGLFFIKNDFSPQCLCYDETCYVTDYVNPYDIALNTLPRKLFYVEYILGIVAIALNLTVAITICVKKALHTPSFILISNLALCDLVFGIYTILIARYTVYELIINSNHYPGTDTFINKYCNSMGILFTAAQMTAVPTSFVATLERFCSIIWCMNPDRRIRKKVAIRLSVLFWVISLTFALIPLLKIESLIYHGEYTCMLPFGDLSKLSLITQTVAIFLALVYMISIFLYVPIYKTVQSANATAGIKRKGTLAKNIAIMITTNFLFFVIPLAASIVFAYHYTDLMRVLGIDNFYKLRVHFIIFSWLPVVLLSMNSCLNPFLCAFRHPKFRAQLYSLLTSIWLGGRDRRGRNTETTSHSSMGLSNWTGVELAGSESNKHVKLTRLTFTNIAMDGT